MATEKIPDARVTLDHTEKTMLIPKENRRKIYEYLFKEGVLVVKKDFNAPKHQEIDVPNLQVLKALQSMQSRGLVISRFSWQYFYYYLTNEGIEYLREYLNLPVEVVPETLKPTKVPATRPSRFTEDRPRRQQDDYRRSEKKTTAEGDFKPEFRGGVGRGAPRQ